MTKKNSKVKKTSQNEHLSHAMLILSLPLKNEMTQQEQIHLTTKSHKTHRIAGEK